MRISGNGKRIKNNETKVSRDIENKISRGTENILKSRSNSVVKTDTNIIENEKTVKDKESLNLEIENSNNSKNRFKVAKNKSKKNKEPLIVKPVGKLSKKRIAGIVLTGLLGSSFVGAMGYGLYYNVIRYPWQLKEDISSSGLDGINRWVDAINTYSNDIIKEQSGEDSYLAMEFDYANGNDSKIKFIKKVISTVNYKPMQVKAKNIYGNTLISRVDNKEVYTDSLVNGVDEEVTLSYIDYSNIPLDEDTIREIVKKNNLTIGLGDYSNGLVLAFCEYINSLDKDSIPLKEESHIPSMVNIDGKYYMTADEDIYLDKVLFSSKEFYDLLDRFSLIACKGMINPDWTYWNNLPDKEGKEEPVKVLETLGETSAWLDWNSKEDKESIKEPAKYIESRVMSKTWCGAYNLMNGGTSDKDSKPILADVGDGTIDNPASINTGVVTSMFVSNTDSNGNISRVSKPIKVKLIDCKVSKDALDYFESKDIRNRGYDIKSKIQYISYSFEVTNLSDEELTIYDNSSLSDSLANLSPRTGTVYGLQSSVTLKPYETGVIESWGCSTELDTKYLIWGGDFNREEPVVWFRVLAGNKETNDKEN